MVEKNNDIEDKKAIESKLIESIINKENTTKENLKKAEKIGFKGCSDNLLPTDQFGVVKDEAEQARKSIDPKQRKRELLMINARIEKWNVMITQYNIYSTTKYAKLKERTRKGVPDSLRAFVWQRFADVSKYYVEELYEKYQSVDQTDFDEATILKDLDRTFPNILFFKEKYGTGQRALFHVLSAYSKYNTQTGYVQGMGFITAMLLTYMDQEMVFFMLHSLMKKYHMEGFYLTDFPDLNKTFYTLLTLLKKFVPRVYTTLFKAGVMPSMYASEWFITLFSKELQFNTLVRIFDVFLLEGFKVMYRFALAFLKINEAKIIAESDMIGLMPLLKSIFEGVEVEELFNIAFRFSLSRDTIKKIEAEYETEKNNKNNEIMNLL